VNIRRGYFFVIVVVLNFVKNLTCGGTLRVISRPLSFTRKKAWQRKRTVAPLRCRGLIDAFLEKSFAKNSVE